MKKARDELEKTIVVSIEKSMWKSLRKVSFDHEISMSELTRMGIEKILNKFERRVDVKL